MVNICLCWSSLIHVLACDVLRPKLWETQILFCAFSALKGGEVSRFPGGQVTGVQEEKGEESTASNVYYRGPRQTIQLLRLEQLTLLLHLSLEATIHLHRVGQAT